MHDFAKTEARAEAAALLAGPAGVLRAQGGGGGGGGQGGDDDDDARSMAETPRMAAARGSPSDRAGGYKFGGGDSRQASPEVRPHASGKAIAGR